MDRFGDWFATNWFGVVGIVAGGIIAVCVALWQRRPAILDYRIIAQNALLSQHASRMNVPLTVNYLGNSVKNPYLVRVRITNTGRVAVRAEDYVEPITIDVSGVDVYDMFIPDQSPAGIIALENAGIADGSLGLDRCIFTPSLLNPGGLVRGSRSM